MDLPTSLTGIGVRGVKVLPTQAKNKKDKHKQRHAKHKTNKKQTN